MLQSWVYNLISLSQARKKIFKLIIDDDSNKHQPGRMELIHNLLKTVKMIGIKASDSLYEAQANVLRSEAAGADSMKNSKWPAGHGQWYSNIFWASISHTGSVKENDIGHLNGNFYPCAMEKSTRKMRKSQNRT